MFLGASIQDPNLNRYLRAASAWSPAVGPLPKRFAAVSLQGQKWGTVEPALRTQLLEAERRRLYDMSIVAIQADYFFQIPQVLHEMTLARRFAVGKYFARNSKVRYGPRLMMWWREATRIRLRRSPPAQYATIQQRLNAMMKQFRVDLERSAGIPSRQRERERLKVELWVRNPEERRLELWGSSENISTEAAHVPARPLEVTSRFASVKAFCYGSIQRVDVPGDESRWKYFIGLPVVLFGDIRWHQLPVACVTLASTQIEAESALQHESDQLQHWRDDVLAVVREYLTPGRTNR
jgi:hypothetical protein